MTSTIDEDASINFTARDYQIEIFEEACRKNVVVCLGTGTGKTFISVLLIKELADQIKGTLRGGGKRTFFLVTTVPLVHQQSKAIENRTFLKVGKYTGDMGVDFWDKDDWRKEFDNHDVLVMTHQILLNMLLHNYLLPSNINLLVLDECHHTGKNHPYAQIMKRIENFSTKPRVMGLTASIINEKVTKRGVFLRQHLEERMREMEIRLRAVCFTCADQSTTLQYAAKPKEDVIGYQDAKINSADFAKMHEEISNNLQFKGEKPQDKREGDAYKKCENALRDLLDILNHLGSWCTYKAAFVIKRNLEQEIGDSCASRLGWLEHAAEVARIVIRIFEEFAVSQFGRIEDILLMEPLVSPKALKLMELLAKQKKDLCAIVFVQKRITAHVLSELIKEFAACYPHYDGINSDFVYGHNFLGLLGQRELCSMTSKNQEKILSRFRSLEFNVLVTTSVVEEGLDVRKCNLVVRFDGLSNYREYVQSKGRARARESKFVVMSREEDISITENELEGMREIEQILIEKSRGREIPTEDEIEEHKEAEMLIEPFRVSEAEGAAEINMNNAMGLLHMYCSKLPAGQYTSLMPIFKLKKHPKYGETMAIVSLPINCPVKVQIEGDWLPSKKLAKISAAKEACVRLWKEKELDDHFVPVKRCYDSDDTDDEDDKSGCPGDVQQKFPFNYARKIPDCLAFEGAFPASGLHLYALEMILEKPKAGKEDLRKIWFHENRRTFGLLTAKPLPKVPCFPLFTNAGQIRVRVVPRHANVSLSFDEFESAKNFHGSIIRQYAGDFASGRSFSMENSKSKALLIVLHCNGHSEVKKTKQLVEWKFMTMVSDNKFYSAKEGDLSDAVIRKTYLEGRKGLFYVSEVRHDKSVTDQIGVGKESFEEYYRVKYGRVIRKQQPLLQSIRASQRINYTTPRHTGKGLQQEPASRSVEFLIPELCERLRTPASFHCQSVCLPSLLFRLETILSADELREQMTRDIFPSHLNCSYVAAKMENSFDDIMRKQGTEGDGAHNNVVSLRLDNAHENIKKLLKGRNHNSNKCIKLEVILQSLTTAKANSGFDLERLETLGDSFLKVATSIFLFYKYPMKHEGRLTEKRIRLVSNKKLLKVAQSKGLQNIICNTSFGNKLTNKDEDIVRDQAKNLWLPPMFEQDVSQSGQEEQFPEAPSHVVRDKSLADSVEALIGAFLEHDGVFGALRVMRWFGIDCFCQSLEAIPRNTEAIPLSQRSAYADFDLPKPALYEDNKENRDFVLQQYRAKRLYVVEKTIDYEFKDKSFLVQAFTHMSYHLNQVTGCYQRLEFLGDAVLDFAVIMHLCSTNDDLDPSSLTNIKSALVNNNTLALLTLKRRLHKGLMVFESKLDTVLARFCELADDEIDGKFKNPFNKNPDEGYLAPKVLGDIFESLAGAVFLDCGLDFLQFWSVFYRILKPLIDEYVANVPLNPVRMIMEQYPKATCRFETIEKGKCKCFWKVDGKEFSGVGYNKKMAKAAAAQKAILGN